ncbi:MAG: hypothetical protein IPO60_11260 [Flavobacteriales bacterium]|nr:hypothetical protein [Flavobacteriales bacterium]
MHVTGLKGRLPSLGYSLFTGMLVSGLAFINQYPLVYADTGAYLANSYTLIPSDDRPIGYGLIIRAFSWQSTLARSYFSRHGSQLAMRAPCAWVISEKKRHTAIHLTLLAFLLLCSSLPWYAAQLMADNFTPLILLIAFLLFRAKLLGPAREAMLWLLLFFFIATHNSHLPMAALLSVLILLRHIRAAGLPTRSSFIAQKRFWAVWGGFNLIALGAATMVASFNYAVHDRFVLSRAGNVFLAGRLCEPGIMADYVKTACENNDNLFCKYKDHLPGDAGNLLWDSDQFVQKEGLSISQADSILAPLEQIEGRELWVYPFTPTLAILVGSGPR